VAERALHKVEERCRRSLLDSETVGELDDVPARGDATEILAELPIERERLGAGEHVEVPPARKLIGRVREWLSVASETARGLSDALRDDAHLSEMTGEQREDAVRLAEVDGLEHDGLGTIRTRPHQRSMVRATIGRA